MHSCSTRTAVAAFWMILVLCIVGAEPGLPADLPPAADDAATTAAPPQDAEQAAPAGQAAPAESAPSEPPPAEPVKKPELSRELVALRDRARTTVRTVAGQALSTSEHTPAQLMDACLAFGCTLQVRDGNAAGKSVSAVGALLWNFNCGGYRLMAIDGGRPLPRVGYGLQHYPSQLLATLAQARVAPDYEIRIGQFQGTVADLVEDEKAACRRGANSPHRLIGLSYYLRDEREWTAGDGETWSVSRLAGEELARRAEPADVQCVHQLHALSFALAKEASRDEPLDETLLRVREYLVKYRDYALRVQNADGSWNEFFFAFQGPSRSELGALRSTGHILEWLAMSLPEDRLAEPGMVRAVGYTTNLVSKHTARGTSALSPRDFESVMHAIRALSIYDARFFAPQNAQP